MLQVKGKVAFITGALGGIGQAYTLALLRNGLKGVALIDVCADNAESFQTELSNEFGSNKSIFIKTDLRDKKQIIDALEKTVAHFKQLDIVINNAGIADENNAADTVTINLVAPLIITDIAMKTYLPKYQKEVGFIINTSSVVGLASFPQCPFYSVSKHGVASMSQIFGTQENYENFKVKVLTICPGITATPLMDKVVEDNKEISIPKEACQKVSAVGECLIRAIESKKNGSVWVVESNIIKEFDYSQFEDISKNFINELCAFQYLK